MSSSPSVANITTSDLLVKDPVPLAEGPTANASSTTTATDSAEILSKDERRRLKKLRKRATRFFPTGDLSGVTKREEWEEVKRALAKTQENYDDDKTDSEVQKDYAPWVGMRQNKKHDRNKIRDGFDHRSTLKYLFHSSQNTETNTHPNSNKNGNSKKRKHEDNGTSLSVPSWVCFHNPACVDHIAVIEVHVSSKELKGEAVFSKLDACLGANNGYETNWFDGPRPQSISDVLLYEKPPQSSRKKANPLDLSTDDGKKELVNKLKSFVLSSEELKKEGYPMADDKERPQNAAATTICKEFRKPGSFTLEEAKTLVEPNHAKFEDREFPFVQALSTSQDTTEIPRILGVDCEMVKTESGIELARITVIEYEHEASESFSYRVLMDELVVPYPPVLDYVTEFSGITETMLKDVTTRLEQVQAALLAYIRPTDILVGHSLENDLVALRYMHPTVIDTALLFQTKGHFKYSLKHLSNVLLKKQIQGKADGHCSEEDAAATLELAIRRAVEGPSFGIQSNDKHFWLPPPTEKKPHVFIGPSPWLTTHATSRPSGIHALTCDDVEHPNKKAMFSWLTGPRRRAGLVWANLELNTPSHLDTLERTLTVLTAKMPASTVLMVNIQQNFEFATNEFKRRGIRKNLKSTLPWNEKQEEFFKLELEDSRKGKIYWVTQHPGPVGAPAT